MEIKKLVGKNVKRIREDHGWSQEDLAFEADLHRTYISGVERVVRNPTVVAIAKMANALEVTPDVLLKSAGKKS